MRLRAVWAFSDATVSIVSKHWPKGEIPSAALSG
jgi:hypothetical protein